jgi:hypothetical protein
MSRVCLALIAGPALAAVPVSFAEPACQQSAALHQLPLTAPQTRRHSHGATAIVDHGSFA